MALDVSLEDGILHIRYSGEFTADDLQDTARQLDEIEAGLRVTPSRVADLSAVTAIAVGYDQVLQLAAIRTARRLANPIRTAIIASDAVPRQIAKWFSALNHNPNVTIRIFETAEDGLAWVLEGATAGRPDAG